LKYDNSKLLGRIKELYGTQEKFGEALGWTSSKTSQKLSNLGMWRLADIRKAVRVLRIEPDDIHAYFFS